MNTGHIFSCYKRRVTMPRTKSGEGPGQDFKRSGANRTLLLIFRPGPGKFSLQWSGAGLGHVFYTVRGTILCKISKIGAKRTCIDIGRVVVELSDSSATPYSMVSLLKNFSFSKPNLPLTSPM